MTSAALSEIGSVPPTRRVGNAHCARDAFDIPRSPRDDRSRSSEARPPTHQNPPPRGRRKVDTQWKLYCLVHNIEKLMRYGTIGSKS